MIDLLARAGRFLSQKPGLAPLAAGITGAHYYGFASPDSDLDLKGIHVAPLADVLSLDPPQETIDETTVFEGQEIDFTSHELAFALRLLIKGNGNMLERILTPLQVVRSSWQGRLVDIALRSVSRRFLHHYRGFFAKKCRDHERAQVKTVKDLLYVYRSALTGIHLLTTGQCVGDVTQLAPAYGFPHVMELVQAKRRSAEHGPLVDGNRFEDDRRRLETMLDEAHARSPLPEDSQVVREASAFLVEVRLESAGIAKRPPSLS